MVNINEVAAFLDRVSAIGTSLLLFDPWWREGVFGLDWRMRSPKSYPPYVGSLPIRLATLLPSLCLGLALLLSAGSVTAAETSSLQAPKPEEERSVRELEKLLGTPITNVYGVSKFQQEISKAPATVTILSSDEFKFYGHRTLADALETVPGMYVTYDRRYSFLGVRGFNRGDNNARVLLLVDGHRMNDNIGDSAAIGTDFLVDPDLIDHVEVIKGPGSALYGNNAFFGVINVITRKGDDFNRTGRTWGGVEASGQVASYDTFGGRFSYGNRLNNGLEAMVSGSLYNSAGPDYWNTDRADDDSYGSFFGTVSNWGFTLQGGYIKRDKANPTGQYGTIPADPNFSTVDERGYADLTYRRQFDGDVEVSTRLYYDVNSSLSSYPFAGDATLDQNDQAGQWWGAEAQLTKRFGERHTLTLGAEYRDDFQQSLAYYPNPALPPSANYERTAQSYGFYAQGDVSPLTNLHVNAGLRYDQYEDVDGRVNPRVGVIYQPFGATVFKWIWGTAFRAPNFFEQILAGPNQLEPETITTYEMVYEQGLGKYLRSSISGFYNDIEDLITFDQGAYRNLDGARAAGVEVALTATWKDYLQGRASYTYVDTEDTATGQTLTDSPHHLGKLNLTVPVFRRKPRVFLGAEWQYVSDRMTVQSTGSGGTVPGPDAPAYNLFNLTVFAQDVFVRGLELSGSCYNILDEDYVDPATPQHLQSSIPQYGRTFRFKLTYRY